MEEKRRIAIIDDDEVFHLIVRKQLEMKNLDCEVLKFYNGEEAAKYFKEGKNGGMPDLVMLDVNMPVKDGWGFLEEYKLLPDTVKSKIRVYMVTSSVIQSDIDRATNNSDVVDFVSKPITNEKLEEIFLNTATS
ncbi:MAG: response regulator [Reichenbachiella sp.]